MRRRKLDPTQLPLLEPTFRWSEVPLDVQRKLLNQLARLLVQTGHLTSQPDTPPSAAHHETFPTQENHHDSR